MLSTTLRVARDEAQVVFPDAEIPRGLGSLWDESQAWSLMRFNRRSTSISPDFESPHDMYSVKQAHFRLQLFLPPRFYTRKRPSKDQPNAVSLLPYQTRQESSFWYCPSSDERTRSIAITSDVTRVDLSIAARNSV